MFGAGTRLARQDLGCHLGDALVFLHKLAFPEIFGPAKPLLWGDGDRQPVRQTLLVPHRQRLGLVVDLPLHRVHYLLDEVQRHPNIVAHITSITTLLFLAATRTFILFYPYRSREPQKMRQI